MNKPLRFLPGPLSAQGLGFSWAKQSLLSMLWIFLTLCQDSSYCRLNLEIFSHITLCPLNLDPLLLGTVCSLQAWERLVTDLALSTC